MTKKDYPQSPVQRATSVSKCQACPAYAACQPIKANLKALRDAGIPALIADSGMRQRDARFKDQAQHKGKPDPLHDKSGKTGKAKTKAGKRYRPGDFH